MSRDDLGALLLQQEAVARLGQLALTELCEADLVQLAVELVADRSAADGAVVLEGLPDDTGVMARASAGCAVEHQDGGGTTTTSAAIGLDGGTSGSLVAHRHDGRPFAQRDVHFLHAIANVLGSSIRRRHAETELRRTHALFSAVIESTPDSVFVKDLEGRYVVLNEALAARAGRPRAELIGGTAYDIFAPEVARSMTDADRQVVAAGEARTFEEATDVEGVGEVALVTKGPLFDDAGRVVGLFGISRDITDRKRQEEALARSEERLRLAQEGARMGTWELDLRTGEATWSDSLYRLFGVDPGEEVGFDRFMGLVHPDDRERVRETIERATVRDDFETEHRVLCADGECRWILGRTSRCRDDDGTVVRILGICTDVTEAHRADEERARLEARLRQAERLEVVGQLAGGIAHDFNNLLLALRGYGELALRRITSGEPGAAEDVAEMIAAADRAAALTRQLLAFSRRQVLNPEVLDLVEVVGEIDKLLRRLIGEHVELVTDAPGEPVLVEADRGQLGQVITNLAVNARDAMPAGGRLTLRVSTAAGEDGRWALLGVADSGCGMDPETAARIFEPFFTTKGQAGTGLGLATVHGIVTQSGGHLSVSTLPGEGTTFEVYLPLSSESPSWRKLESVGDPDPAETGSGERILLIEDDPVVRSIVQLMLEDSGYRVLPAGGGEDAVELLRQQESPVQLAVSDMIMRGLNGRETVERLRRRQPDLRVLYMSGYTADTEVHGGTLRAGTAFIQKPFSGDELNRSVRRLLDREAA